MLIAGSARECLPKAAPVVVIAYHHVHGHRQIREDTLCLGVGHTDATVQKVGLDVRRYAADKETLRNGLAVGHPRYVQMGEERRWNAHLVVRLGDVFIDPSMSQARRPWNKLPDFGVIIPGRQAPSNLEVEGEFTKTKAFWEYKHEFEFIQIRYFELLRAQDIPTRGFLSAPDAKPEARNDVVGIATSVLAKQRR